MVGNQRRLTNQDSKASLIKTHYEVKYVVYKNGGILYWPRCVQCNIVWLIFVRSCIATGKSCMMRDVYAGIAHTEYEYKYHIALKYRWPRTRNMYDDIVKWKRFRITVLCESNPPVTGGLSSQRTSNSDLRYLFGVSPKLLLNKTLQWSVKWDGMTLMWHHCNMYCFGRKLDILWRWYMVIWDVMHCCLFDGEMIWFNWIMQTSELKSTVVPSNPGICKI